MHKATKQNVPTQIQKRKKRCRAVQHKKRRKMCPSNGAMIKTDRQLIGLI